MNKIKLNEEIHLEKVGGSYYKPFNKNGDEIKGILLKDCTELYDDGMTWEKIYLMKDGSLDVGPFHWDGEDLTQMGSNNFVFNRIMILNDNQKNK
jgi:hypothetical protein